MSHTKTYICTLHNDITKSTCTKKYTSQSALNKHIRKHHEYRYGKPGPAKCANYKEMVKERSKRYRDTHSLSVCRKENARSWLRKGVKKASSITSDHASTLRNEINAKAKDLFEELVKSPTASQKPFLHATLVCLVMHEAQYNFGMHEFVQLLNRLFGDGFYSTVLQFDDLEKREEFEWVAQQIYNKRSLVLALGSIVQDVVARSYFYHKSNLFTYKAQEAIKHF